MDTGSDAVLAALPKLRRTAQKPLGQAKCTHPQSSLELEQCPPLVTCRSRLDPRYMAYTARHKGATDGFWRASFLGLR
jgi:hypothetical protein